MLEKKFRAWDRQWKRMSAPMELFKNGQSFFFFKGFGVRAPTCESLIVLQYTGLDDVNNKEVYEGYTLKDVRGTSLVYAVEYSKVDARYVTTGKAGGGDFQVPLTERIAFLEVVGNIYETPALLEAGLGVTLSGEAAARGLSQKA